MKKEKKQEKDLLEMTADEVIADVFHPKVAEHMRKRVEEHARKVEAKEKRKK
jgi:hypothetical protein